LWIDAICINQDDIDERNEQVRMMGNIYQKAERVTVWLGDGLDSHLVPGVVGELDFMRLRYAPAARSTLLEYREKVNTDAFESRRWNALIHLFSRPWFGRIWVVQEVAVARRLHVLYGGRYIPWNVLVEVSDIFFHPESMELMCLLQHTATPGTVGEPPSGAAHLGLMESLRVEIKYKTPLTLARLLEACQDFEATDAKDKVFAIQGISTAAFDISLLIDYKKEVYDIYVDTAYYLLRQADLIKVLHLAGIGWPREAFPSKDGKRLPSWVPDWSTSHGAAMLAQRYFDPEDNYCASRRNKPQICAGNTLDTIMLGGLYVDKIGQLGEPLDFGQYDWGRLWEHSTMYMKSLSWDADVHRLASKTPEIYANGQSRAEALWRTLIGDRIMKERPAPASYSTYYGSWNNLILSLREHWPSISSGKIPPGMDAKDLLDTQLQIHKYSSMVGPVCAKRRFCVTENKYMAVVPPKTEPGDMICIVHGAQTPLILRRLCHKEKEGVRNDTYAFVGECYVHGMMNGEMLDTGYETEWFTIQ
jgi:Heterokaryon incompatibility protein (HET)